MTHLQRTLRTPLPGFLFAPEEGKGGSGGAADPPAQGPFLAETVDVEAIDKEKEELAKLALADDDDDEVVLELDDEKEKEKEKAKEGEGDGDKPKEKPAETPAELTKEQVEELARKHGILKEPEKQAVVQEGKKAPPKIPAFKDEAFAEAWEYEEFIEDDGEGGKVLSDAGIQWAENRALQLATDYSSREKAAQEAERRTQDLARSLQDRKPQIVEDFTKGFIETGKIKEEVVKEFTPLMVDILMGFGPAAFDDGSEESDPKVKDAKATLSINLRTAAYYQALGVQYEKILTEESEGGAEDDTPKEKVKVGGGDPPEKDAITMESFSKEDQIWIKKTWIPEMNDGKPPTKEELKRLYKEINK